jgi:hypothetical protein
MCLKVIALPFFDKITDYKRWITTIYSILINRFMLITVIRNGNLYDQAE